jgi:hypothetical protein
MNTAKNLWLAAVLDFALDEGIYDDISLSAVEKFLADTVWNPNHSCPFSAAQLVEMYNACGKETQRERDIDGAWQDNLGESPDC